MLTALLILIPIVFSIPLLLSPTQINKPIALASSIFTFALTLYICFNFKQNADMQFGFNLSWFPSLGIHIKAGIDGISLIMVLLTNLLIPFIVLSADKTLEKIEKPNMMLGLILIMQGALIGVFTALDGFVFYVFWELALIPIYLICLIWGGENRVKITLKFFVYTMVGSLMMLVGLIYLAQHTADHTFDIQSMYAAGKALTAQQQGMVFWLICPKTTSQL